MLEQNNTQAEKNDFKKNNPNPYIDMTGKRINMLTVMYKAPSKKGRTMWKCKCDCGNEVDIWYAHLKKRSIFLWVLQKQANKRKINKTWQDKY